MKRGILFISLFFFGCSITKFAVNKMVPTFDIVMSAAYRMNDALIMKEGLPSNIILLEGLHRISPENDRLLILNATAYCSYALGFIEDEDPERAIKLYLRGRDYALSALFLNKRVKKLLKKHNAYDGKNDIERVNRLREIFENEEKEIMKMKQATTSSTYVTITPPSLDEKDYEKIVKKLGFKKEDAPYFFWAGNCWAGWLNLSKKDPKALFDISNILTIMKMVRALDDKYFYGGPRLFFALYYAGLPALMGGGPEKAKKEFEEVFKITEGKFLLAKAFYAKFYAALIKDEELFDKIIEEVLSTPSDIDPDLTLMNEIAKRKARLFRDKKSELF